MCSRQATDEAVSGVPGSSGSSSFRIVSSSTPANHCRGCGAELEPLRRYGGLCKQCVGGTRPPAPPPTEQLRSRFRFLREVFKQRAGHRERFAEVECECGRRRVLQWKTWSLHRPRSCNRCRLKEIEARGFEAEAAR